MYHILGIVSVVLFITVTSPYWLRRLNQWFFHQKGGALMKWIKGLRVIHKPLGILLALMALFHGYLALGSLRLHTGSITWIMLLITVILGGWFYRKKKAAIFAWHKRAALTAAILMLIHLLIPNALYYIFG